MEYNTVTIPAGTNESGVIATAGQTAGRVAIDSAWTAADLHVYGAARTGGTYYQLVDAAGAPIEITNVAADVFLPLPSEAFEVGSIKLVSVSTADDSAVNQAAERTLVVTLR